MLKKAEMRVVVAFNTTADAMAVEKLCKQNGIPGRLFPVPRQLTSDCGIAWNAPPEDRARLTSAIAAAGIETAGIFELMI